MADLDVGRLRAVLQLDGADEYQRGLDGAREGMERLSGSIQTGARQANIAFSQTSAEAKKLADAAVAGAEKGVQARNKELDAAERLRRAEVDLGRARQGGDTERVLRAEANLDRARRNHETALRRAAAAEQEGVNALERYARAARDAEQAHGQLGDTVSRTNPFSALSQQARESGREAGENLADGMPAPIAAAVRAAGPVGAAIAGVVLVGTFVGKQLADNIVAGMEKQALANRDKVRFGWTDDQAKTYGAAAADSYVAGWGESIDGNRDAAGMAIQVGLVGADATEAEMKDLLDKLGVIAEMTGEESKETISQLGQLVKTGLVKDWQEGASLIVAAQQAGVNQLGDMGDLIKENGALWKALGIDAATGLDIANRLVKGGLENFDQVSEIFEELGEAATAGTEETTEALAGLGLNAATLPGILAKGGQEAEDATLKIFRGLQQIQDPLKRNEIGTELFGSQWVKLQGIITGIDFTGVENGLGGVADRAQQAQDALGGPAAAMESAKRSVEKSLGEVQVKLAETFGPKIAEAAEWVSTHTDEITRAFEIVGGVVTTVGGAVGMVAGTIIGAVGETIEATAKLVRGVLGPIFGGMEKLGGVMAKMPGAAGELGTALQKGAAGGRAWIDTWVEAGEATSDFGWGMTRVSTSITQAGIDLTAGTDRAKTATEAFSGLGIKVREVPNEKRIIIEDNSPETKTRLEELGFTVQTLPDGSLYIDAQDKDAADKIAELVKKETKVIEVQVTEARAGGVEVRDRNGNVVLQGGAKDTPVGAPGKSSGGVGSRANPDGTTTHTRGGKELDANGKPTGTPANPSSSAPPAASQTGQTKAQKDAAEKAAKEAAAAKAKAEREQAAAAKKTAAEQAAAAKKASDAAAKIPGLESALAIAEQKVRELKPNASTSSRMTAEQSVTKAREALEKAREAAKGATTTSTTTSSDGKPVTVTGDGSGGTVTVGTGSKPVQVESANSTGEGLAVRVTNWPAGGVGGGIKLSLFAGGGSVRGPGTGTSDSIPAMLSNGEFVVNAEQTARFGGLLQAINSGRVRAFRDGGAVNGLQSGAASLRQIIMDQFGISDVGGYRAEDGYGEHSTGRALDVMVSDITKGTAVKDFVVANAKALGLKWAIWQQAMWYPDGSTTPMEDRGSPTQNHMDHVHVFLDESSNGSTFSLDGSSAGTTTEAQLAQVGSLTAQSTKEQIAAAIISEGRKRGFSDTDIRAVLATALQESKLDPSADGGDQGIGGALGLFQQGSSYGETIDRTDPNKAITAFYDRLGETTGDDIYQRITGVQQHGGAYQGTGGDQAYMDQIQGKATEADALFSKVAGSVGSGSALTTSGTGTKPTTTTTTGAGTQNVYVTGGKLDSVGTGGGSQYKFSLFNTGGPVSGPGTSTSDSIPAMLSDGEYVVRASSARANHRLLETINRAGGPLRLAGGGGVGLPKIEAPKIAPTVGPGMALPIPAATPTVGAGSPGIGVDPLAALKGTKQEGVGGTFNSQEYMVQRLIQYGGDMAKVLVAAGKEIALPSGLDSQQAQNVLSLIKGVGTGIQSSYERSQSQTSTSTDASGKTVNNTTTNNFYTQNVDEAFRKQTRQQSVKALSYGGSLP